MGKRKSGRPDQSQKTRLRVSQELRISQLEKRLQNLEAAFGQNTEIFAGGFDIADMRIFACHRLLCDLAIGRPPYYQEDSALIDFTKYYGEYLAMLGFQVLAQTYAGHSQEPESDESHAVVFGGES